MSVGADGEGGRDEESAVRDIESAVGDLTDCVEGGLEGSGVVGRAVANSAEPGGAQNGIGFTLETNPLAGNKPQKGIGTITSPAPTKETPKPVKMDAETKRIAEMFGNTDEEIRKYLG